MSAPFPTSAAHEQARLEALRRYAILDTPPELVFDELVQQAARECGYDAAVLSLMDSHRAWFKARAGLAATADAPHELPREHTFCNHAFRSSGHFVVRDARSDPRFAALPTINREGGFRAYLGMQLITPDGFSIGSLALLHREPREPTAEQRAAHQRFTCRAMALLEGRRLAQPTPVPARSAVLVVDDEPSILQFAQVLLGRRGVPVFAAGDGLTAREIYRAHAAEIGLILTDYNMPGLTGLDLIRELRRAAEPPVFTVMTGRLTADLRHAFAAEGVALILEKPFPLADFEVIFSLLAGARANLPTR